MMHCNALVHADIYICSVLFGCRPSTMAVIIKKHCHALSWGKICNFAPIQQKILLQALHFLQPLSGGCGDCLTKPNLTVRRWHCLYSPDLFVFFRGTGFLGFHFFRLYKSSNYTYFQISDLYLDWNYTWQARTYGTILIKFTYLTHTVLSCGIFTVPTGHSFKA